jgi:2-polyprenyl-3-methyl-5-hydroxy-6-metoxy-1,4-benzoquinol methylase
MNFTFGKTQYVSSDKMKRSPALSKLIYNVFGYTSVGNYARSRVVIRLLNQLPLDKFERIIDLGAGLGEFTFMMADQMPKTKFLALEILPERVEKLREIVKKFGYSNVEVYPDLIEKLDADGQFDFIFAVDVFEHIPEEQMPFKDCYKKLKPGGYLMIKIPNAKQRTILPDRFFEDHHEWLEGAHVGQVYDLQRLTQRFKDEGFTIVHSSSSDGLLSRIGWELGYLSRKGGAIPQLLCLPFCKAFVLMDRFFFNGRENGNAIQVIGRK